MKQHDIKKKGNMAHLNESTQEKTKMGVAKNQTYFKCLLDTSN